MGAKLENVINTREKEGEERVKQPKKPTRENKVLMSKHGLVPNNWMVLSESKTDLTVISRNSGQRRVLMK